jgi:hypothetical protein
VQLPCQIPVRTVRADEARDGNGAAIGEELGDLGDATDVLFAVLRTEAKVFVQAETDVIAVEAVGGEVIGLAEEGLFQGDGDGGFAGRGEAGEPYCEALLPAEGGADGGSDGARVKGDVAVDDVVSTCNVRRSRCTRSPDRGKQIQQLQKQG